MNSPGAFGLRFWATSSLVNAKQGRPQGRGTNSEQLLAAASQNICRPYEHELGEAQPPTSFIVASRRLPCSPRNITLLVLVYLG